MKRMAAGALKAQRLAVMDEVLRKGEAALIPQHGKSVAKRVAADNPVDNVFGFMTA